MNDGPRGFQGRGIVAAILAFACAGLAGAATRPPSAIPLRSSALRFEANVGQTDPQVRFLSGSRSGDVFLTPGEIVLSARRGGESADVRLHFLGGNPNPRIVGLDRLPGVTNYFIGNDPKKWRTNVPAFARVKYADVYPGIDLVAYGNDGKLEYDFQVASGADPKQIAMSVEGADRVALDAGGDLVLRTALGEVRQCAPRIYQRDEAGTHEIAGGYAMRGGGTVAFTLAAYDAAKPLVIDPTLAYATYFGGSAETDIHAIATDAAGFLYVAGDTYAHDFPTKNPVQSTNRHDQSLSAIVSKLTPDGASLVYSTYLGGSDTFAVDVAVGIAVDSTGAAYVTGTTGSSDFPTKNAIPGVAGHGTDVFVTKLSADGSSLVYSTLLGGSDFDEPRGIQLDSVAAAFIYGDTQSTDFPTVNPTQASSGGGRDGFWSIISPDGSRLLFSTYLGGNDDDDVRSLSVIPQNGDVYASGQTQSSNFAGNDGSLSMYQAHFQPDDASSSARSSVRAADATIFDPRKFLTIRILIAKSQERLTIVPLSFFPSPGNHIFGYLDRLLQAGDIEVFVSSACVAVPPATTCTGNASVVTADATTLEVKSAINLPDTIPPITAVTWDAQGAIYAVGPAGRTSAPPLVDPIQGTKGGADDAFVMVLAPGTRAITFSTYLGGGDDDEANGITLDPQGNIYVAGQTQSSDFPTKNALQPTAPAPNGATIGDGNSFIAKISSGAVQTVPREPVEPVRPGANSTHTLPPRSAD